MVAGRVLIVSASVGGGHDGVAAELAARLATAGVTSCTVDFLGVAAYLSATTVFATAAAHGLGVDASGRDANRPTVVGIRLAANQLDDPDVRRALVDNGRATFFLLGRMVDDAARVAAQIIAAGHEVAVHGDRHVSTFTRTSRQVHDDLERAIRKIEDATGYRPRWFRPPYGHLSIGAWRVARELDLEPVLWTSWGRDWRAGATPESILADIRRGLLDAGTILLHDSDCTSAADSWRNTAQALPAVIAHLRARQLHPGPLREHWAEPRSSTSPPR